MKQKGIALLPILIIILVIVVAGGFAFLESTGSIDLIKSKSTTTTIIGQKTKITSPTTSQVGATTTTTGEGSTTANEGVQIIITAPVANQLVTSPLTVQGRAINLFENTCLARLKDSSGAILATKVITTDAPDMGQWGNFSVSFVFKDTTMKTGTLEVFQESSATGAEVGKVTVQVKFH